MKTLAFPPSRLLMVLLAASLAFPAGWATTGSAPGLQAQAPQEARSQARLFGTVTDASKGGIPGAEVTLERKPGGQKLSQVTDDVGNFEFKNLLPATYQLTASLEGFQTFQEKVVLKADESRRLDVVLQVGEIAETITVTGSPMPIATEAATVSGAGVAEPPLDQRSHFNTEAYDHIDENDFVAVSEQPRSTFSIDVDTASYANVRRFLNTGKLPPRDAVRIEELINYFNYQLPPPRGGHPFQVSLEMSEAPWDRAHRLLSIGIQGKVMDEEQRPPGNFVFLLDVSGSMSSPDKLPLLKKGLRYMVDRAASRDRIAIVAYAGAAGQVLAPTPGDRKASIIDALEGLEAEGSTNGAEGIQLAYDLAARHFQPNGINRVILATDGDFNVGITNQGDLVRLIEKQAERGIFLTVLGFGAGNLKDSTMEKLADRGNGNYAYIDSLLEARKVLAEELGGTLVTIAKDVKIQAEFNPLRVESYRLLGYENRLLEDRDFNDDEKDAGEIGAGHSLMVLYELVPFGEGRPGSSSDALRYQSEPRPNRQALSEEWMFLKLRYKRPQEERSRLLEIPVGGSASSFPGASADLRFSASVAAFGMLLRESPHRGNATFEDALSWARDSLGPDPGGYRQDHLDLLRKAADLYHRPDAEGEPRR